MPPDLFEDTERDASSPIKKVLRPFDSGAVAGEMRLRVRDVDTDVRKLEEAQIVTQELLETVVSR